MKSSLSRVVAFRLVDHLYRIGNAYWVGPAYSLSRLKRERGSKAYSLKGFLGWSKGSNKQKHLYLGIELWICGSSSKVIGGIHYPTRYRSLEAWLFESHRLPAVSLAPDRFLHFTYLPIQVPTLTNPPLILLHLTFTRPKHMNTCPDLYLLWPTSCWPGAGSNHQLPFPLII